MNKPGYFAVLLMVFGLVLASAAGQEGEAGVAASQEPPEEEPIPKQQAWLGKKLKDDSDQSFHVSSDMNQSEVDQY